MDHVQDQDVAMMDEGEEHECDSAGGLRLKRSANAENDAPSNVVVVSSSSSSSSSLKMAPVVVRSSPPSKASGSSSSAASAVAANKLRIDKIAENLKINLQQKKEKAEAAKLKEATSVVNTTMSAAPKVVTVLTQRPPQMLVKRVSPIVAPRTNTATAAAALAKSIKEEDEAERNDDDLTNLGWLSNFNLAASVGLPANYPLSLSPPISPPTSTAMATAPVPRAVTVQCVKPVQVARTTSISKYAPPPASAFTLSYGGDEADGGGGQRLKPAAAQLKDISALLKPYLTNVSSPTKTTVSDASAASASSSSSSLQRPPYSFSCLTFLAIESSHRKRLSVKEIYNWITQSFPYYRSVPSGSWKNSIRHNLSYNHCFAKVDKNLLAMRDFSGKGSLWCINPEYRPLLIDTLLKMPMNSEQHQLACIPFLQDVAELPKSSASASDQLNNSSSGMRRSNSLTPSKSSPGALNKAAAAVAKALVKQRSSSMIGGGQLQKMMPPSSPHQLTTTIINPRLASRFMTSSSAGSPTVSQLTQVAASRSKSMAADNCSEMDAVNALLSMKSNRQQQTTSKQTPPEPKKASLTPTTPTSRRKQVFKTPTKAPIEVVSSKSSAYESAYCYMDDDSDEFNEDNYIDGYGQEDEEEEEEDLDQLTGQQQDLVDEDDDEIEEGQVIPASHVFKSKQKRSFDNPTTSQSSPNKKPKATGKLVVKLPLFKAVHSATQQPTHDQDDHDDHEQPSLTIDEGRQDDQDHQQQAVAAAAAMQALNNMNALLELSLAAKLVEEHKQMMQQQQHQQQVKPTKPKVRKN